MEDLGAKAPGRLRLKSQHEFLKDVLELLRRAGIEHMIVGSIASSFHGRPRATQDMDVVVDADLERVAELVRLCAERGYYADSVDAEDAVRHRSLFNVIDPASGHKLDLIIKKARPFSEEEFARRRAVTLLDVEASIATAEDVILAKLEWGQESRSDRQYQDALGIALAQGDSLDIAYLRRWAAPLGIAEDVDRLLRDRERP